MRVPIVHTSPSFVARRPETLETERSGTVVAQCGELEATGEVFGDVRTDEWKTKVVVEQQTSGKAMAIG
jgi:hypothetical protein